MAGSNGHYRISYPFVPVPLAFLLLSPDRISSLTQGFILVYILQRQTLRAATAAEGWAEASISDFARALRISKQQAIRAIEEALHRGLIAEKPLPRGGRAYRCLVESWDAVPAYIPPVLQEAC